MQRKGNETRTKRKSKKIKVNNSDKIQKLTEKEGRQMKRKGKNKKKIN